MQLHISFSLVCQVILNLHCLMLFSYPEEFKLTDEIKASIDEAKTNFKNTSAGLDLNYVEFTKFGKNFIKKQGVSPDSFMQLAIQVETQFYLKEHKI